MDCRICHSERVKPFSHHGYQWAQCQNCRAVIKVLTKPQYDNLNPTYDPGTYFDTQDEPQIKQRLDVTRKKQIIKESLGQRDPRGLDLLDIGCGLGGYLLAGRELGMNVIGIEPSADHSRVATERLGLSVINGYFNAETMKAQFDLVILSHVIEHILQPEEFINEIAGVLRQHGKLLIFTPNADSNYFRLIGKRWRMLSPVDHVSLLSKQSFESMALSDDFTSIKFRQSEYAWEFAASVGAALRTRGNEVAKPNAAPSVASQDGTKALLMKLALTIASAPFYLANRLFDKQACLIVEFEK